MLGHHWESAEGQIVEVAVGPTDRYGKHCEYHYVVEVRAPAEDVLRSTVIHKSADALAVGTLVRVQVNAKTREVRLDSSARSGMVIGVSVADQARAAAAGFASPPSTAGLHVTSDGPGQTRIIIEPGAGPVDLSSLLGERAGPVDLRDLLGRLAASGDPAVHVLRLDGQDAAEDGPG
jgi:hypothetical protein